LRANQVIDLPYPLILYQIFSICQYGKCTFGKTICTKHIGRTSFAHTIYRAIKQTKGYITKQIDFSVWQKSFNDHIIRGQEDYKNIWEYIENNPLK